MTNQIQKPVFQLERLYVALTPGQDGKPGGVQILARTPGVSPDQVAECRRLANLQPPPQRSDDMPGSLGIFRGESIDYIVAKAQQGPNNLPQLQYIFAPATALRWLGGNIRTFLAFGKEPIPQFATPRTDLPAFILDSAEPPDNETQTDDLLALIGYCKNNLKVVEGLLASLVQAMGLGIINAPLSLADRLTFIQGLLMLLPGPARIAITFATSVTDPSQTNTQIKFLATDVRPNRHIIFDWATGKLVNDPPEDAYSKYIMAQLRLDTSLVIQQTEQLARTAVWRAMRKDDMANALGWVSKRASLDSAVQEGLPADRKMVASVLREDPTLPDNLRLSYAKHLVTLALALDDPAELDIIPPLAAQNQEIGNAIYDQLQNAAQGDQALAVYHLIERWVKQPPMGVYVSRWRPLLNVTMLTRVTTLVDGDAEALLKFLQQFLDASPNLQLESTIAQMVGVSRKRAYENADIARTVFLLGALYLPAGGFQRLLSEPPLVAKLPEPVRMALSYLTPTPEKPAPPGVLSKAADGFEPERQPIIFARFIEWALLIQRLDLIDADALNGLIKVALSPLGPRFELLMTHIIEDLSRLNTLKTLDIRAQQYLVELSMARGKYAQAISQLEFYQTNLYKGTKQEDMADITHAIFKEVPLEPVWLIEALQALQDSQIKPIARAHAYLGALEGKNWTPAMEPIVRRFTSIVFADPRQIALIGVEPVMKLLKANAERKDAMETVRLASAIIEYVLTMEENLDSKGVGLVNRVYGLVNYSPELRPAALELLRTVIRRAPLDQAQKLPQLLNASREPDIETALDAAHRLRLVLGGTNFMTFAEQTHLGSELLIDMAIVYHESHEPPPNFKLRRTLESMSGGISEVERKRLADNLNTIGQQVIRLSQVKYRKRSKAELEAYDTQLVMGGVAPANGIDALRWIGGFLSGGQPFPLDLNREAPPHLLGERSVNLLLRDTDALVSLLNGLLIAFPDKDMFMVDLKAWKAEVELQWGLVSLYNQRQLKTDLPRDAQFLAQVVRWIGERGNERSLQSTGYGRQLQQGKAQPRSVVDALRWISGYFAREHESK